MRGRAFYLAIGLLAGGPAMAQTGGSAVIILDWTATGDDSTIGRAASYDIRYRVGGQLSESTWNQATIVPNPPLPSLSGLPDSMWVTGLQSGVTYTFALKARDNADNISGISNTQTVTTLGTTAVEDPQAYLVTQLRSIHPNPVRQSAIIEFSLAQPEPYVRFEVYDLHGRRLTTMHHKPAPPGLSSRPWRVMTDNGDPLPPGMYFLLMHTPTAQFKRSFVVLR